MLGGTLPRKPANRVSQPANHVACAAQIDEWAPRPVAAAAPPEPTAPAPSPPVVPPPSPPVPAVVLVDSVVCAAAEAMALSPQAVRPAVLAAFVRARDAGLAPDAVVAVLSPPTLERR